MKLLNKFLSLIRIDPNSRCWKWKAGKTNKGYGAFYINQKQHTAHRLSYRLFVGEIPIGLDLDHLCRNRDCCNPSHLEAVTRRENLLRGNTIPALNATKTHCKHGHEFTPENTIIKKTGSRDCRLCHLEQVKRAYAEKHNKKELN